MDFLAENNSCGQTLLRMVAKGNATIAELLRLKDVVPTVYSRVQSRADRAKYGDLIQTDFTYFKTAEQFENRVEQSDLLQQLDEELKQNHLELLTRFYRLFESIYRFVVDLNGYIADLEDGVYIQQMIETVFLDGDGKQLMVENEI
jgi:WASH complex subunit strumpellin